MAHAHDPHHGKHGGHPQHEAPKGWQPHKDWRAWLGLVLMLAALAAYVLSLDESRLPGGATQPVVPADAAP